MLKKTVIGHSVRENEPDFFVRLQSLTRRREDLFTECLVAVLREDQALSREFVVRLAGARRLGRTNILSAQISIDPQHFFKSGSGRVDMVIRVGDSIRIGVEHKLLAPESSDQLSRYADIPDLTHFAVIAARNTKLKDCEESWGRRLLRPSKTRTHFLWAEFYDLFATDARPRGRQSSTIRRALARLFEANYLQAAHPMVGYLKHPDPDTQLVYDRAFAKLLGPLRVAMVRRQWKCFESWNPKAKSEMWVEQGPSELLAVLWVHPRHSPGALKVRLKTHTKAARDAIHRAVVEAVIPSERHVEMIPSYLGEQEQGSWALDLIVPWSELFRKVRNRAQAAGTLARYVTAIMDAAA